MKVLLVSTSVQQVTGYAKVSKYLLQELKKHHTVCHFAFQKDDKSTDETFVPTYDSGKEERGFGFSKLQNAVDMITPDAIILYNDPTIIATFLKNLKTEAKILIYYDLPYDGVNQELLKYIDDRAHSYLTMTPKAKKYLELVTKKPIVVVPHGVDETVFYRKSDILKGRMKTFINVNRNSQRKRLDVTIQAFMRYLKAGNEGRLILVTDSRGIYDIPNIFQIEAGMHGLPKAGDLLTFIDTSKTVLTDAAINDLYNQADVNINTSDGEGFGLSVAESSAVGLSQVVTDVGDYTSFADATVVSAPLHYYNNSQVGILARVTTPDMFAEGMAKEAVPARKQKSWTEALEPLISHLNSI